MLLRLAGKDNDIWSFVENKLKCPVPAYFKNVLKVCGYSNGLTIASIGEDDIQYFEEEVKNGNVSKYFKDVEKMNDNQILEGSTKPAEKFEFIRGHRKFLMTIRDLVKNHLDKNGPDSFAVEALPSKKSAPKEPKKKTDDEKIRFAHRKRKLVDPDEVNLPEKLTKDSSEVISEDMKRHRIVLFKKGIKSLQKYTLDLFNEVSELNIKSFYCAHTLLKNLISDYIECTSCCSDFLILK